jgi:hypothetical protein
MTDRVSLICWVVINLISWLVNLFEGKNQYTCVIRCTNHVLIKNIKLSDQLYDAR